MLFITYWELNVNMPVEQRLRITENLTSSGMIPPKGVNIIRWDITADLWGILVAEAESSADINKAIQMWRTAGAGFFKSTRTSPAQPIQEAVAQQGELLKALGAM